MAVDVLSTVEHGDVADLAGPDDLARQLMSRIDGKAVADARDDRGTVRQRDQFIGFRAGVGERLLAIDMLAVLERRLGNLEMQCVRQADVDEIDIRIGDRFTPVPADTLHAQQSSCLANASFVVVDEPFDDDVGAECRKLTHHYRIGVGVNPPHPAACAKHRYYNRLHHRLPILI